MGRTDLSWHHHHHHHQNGSSESTTTRYPHENMTMDDLHILCRRRFYEQQFEATFPETKLFKYPMDKKTYSNGLWIEEPTPYSVVMYSIIIPIISALGIIGNILILIVLNKRNMKTSTYTYLAVLAGADLVTCALLLFSGLARGIFWCKSGWLEFDAYVHIPVGSVSSNITVWAAVCVTIDRLATVYSQPCCKPPKFCDQQIARKLMLASFCFTVIINVPYCFIYSYNEHGDLIATRFFYSRWYNLQNWFQFIVFGLTPAAFLLISNGIMCYSVRKALKQRQLLLKCKYIREGNRLQDQARLTVMLIGIVFVFVIGELPTHLISRRSVISLLYYGDSKRIQGVSLERFRICATLLNAISSSINFVLYFLLSPHFLLHLKGLLRSESTSPCNESQLKAITIQRQSSRMDTLKSENVVSQCDF